MQGIIIQYKIFICPYCGLVQFVKDGQRTRKCPRSKCRKVINLERVVVFMRTSNILEAVTIVQSIKEKKHNLQKIDEIQAIIEEDDND